MKADPKQLAKRFKWWWRDCEDFTLLPNGQTRDNNTPSSHLWKDGLEASAHAYELVRRLKPSKKLPPWPELDMFQQAHLRGTVGRSQHYFVCRLSDHPTRNQMSDPGWTAPYQWNLHASDSALLKRFKAWIHRERKRKGMINRKRVVDLPRKNTVSWRWLEVWDAAERAGVVLDSSERSMKAKAIKQAKQLKPAVMGALADAKRQKLSLNIRQ